MRKLKIILSILTLFIIVVFFIAYQRYSVEVNFVKKVFGFNKQQTYLILFLNNTEIRPAGGFIGAYGVARIRNGKPEILKVEGTELLDNSSPRDFISVPPEQLQKYLLIKRWEFRDSNWSPDFAQSSIKAIDLFKKEKGFESDTIDIVVGITPTLVEEILKISGPIMINGQEFDAKNFTDKLEYEVEYGYAEQGIDFDNRKKVLVQLTHALFDRMGRDFFKNPLKYVSLAQRMVAEKHVLVYARDEEMQKFLLAKGWGGDVKQTDGDYLLWVDANLASLKTDKVINRTLSYSFAPTSSGRYVATVKMRYANNGGFTKFTTRYKNYARVFLPIGSQFISLKNDRYGTVVDQGIENGKRWFGTLISVDPGKTDELIWQFYMDPNIVNRIENKSYSLFVQKQAGIVASGLTLSLNFGKNILSVDSNKMENGSKLQIYDLITDLRTDKKFEIKF